MIFDSKIFSPLRISISPRNQVQIRWFLIPWNRFEVLFHNLPFSPISIINSSSDLIKFEEYIKNSLFPCGFDPYLPLCHSIWVNFPKLVSSILFLTRDRVKSTTSRSHLVKGLVQANTMTIKAWRKLQSGKEAMRIGHNYLLMETRHPWLLKSMRTTSEFCQPVKQLLA